jgi:hypothetical protein
MNKQKLWLPSIFSDNMMLQEGKKNLIWGKSKREAGVSVTIAGRRVSSKADKKVF